MKLSVGIKTFTSLEIKSKDIQRVCYFHIFPRKCFRIAILSYGCIKDGRIILAPKQYYDFLLFDDLDRDLSSWVHYFRLLGTLLFPVSSGLVCHTVAIGVQRLFLVFQKCSTICLSFPSFVSWLELTPRRNTGTGLPHFYDCSNIENHCSSVPGFLFRSSVSPCFVLKNAFRKQSWTGRTLLVKTLYKI